LILIYISNYLFRIKLHLESLVIAVNVTQQANTRCDQVLILLGELCRIYFDIRYKDQSLDADCSDTSHSVTTILNSIEKRWSKVDQNLFIACVFLNPVLKASLFNPQKMTLAVRRDSSIGLIREREYFLDLSTLWSYLGGRACGFYPCGSCHSILVSALFLSLMFILYYLLYYSCIFSRSICSIRSSSVVP
jgi:hypothetical protein